MAEVTAFRNNALPYPVYGMPWTIVFPIFDKTGALVSSAAGLDSEVSLNGDTPADCTNEATEIGSSAEYYLTLTAAEMTADIVAGVTKTSTTDAKTTPWVLYPRKLSRLVFSTCAGGSSNYFQLAASDNLADGFYAGCLANVTIDGTDEYRVIVSQTGAVAAVTPNWVTASPDTDDPYQIFIPEDRLTQGANIVAIAGSSTAANKLRRSADSMYLGTVASGTSTTIVDSGLTQSANDHWKGRVVIMLTGSLAGQASDITAFTASSDTLTFTAFTSTVTAGDTYIIL